MTAGSKRTSTEPTLVIPRDALPPVSTVPGPTIEQLADIERSRRDLEESLETLVPCPAGCANGLVTHTRRQELLAVLAPPAELPDEDLVVLDEPGEVTP